MKKGFKKGKLHTTMQLSFLFYKAWPENIFFQKGFFSLASSW